VRVPGAEVRVPGAEVLGDNPPDIAGGLMRVRDTVIGDLRSAWRGLRARKWRVPLIVGLLAVSLGAAGVVFSAADSFVFGRVPYPNATRLIVLQRTSAFSGTNDYLPPENVAEWRKHTDLFSSVHAHDRGPSAYLTTGDLTESVRSQLVTPGLFEALGSGPRWGRLLQPGDEAPDRDPVAVIGEELARRVFGDPATAVGQTMKSGEETLLVVGVMPATFRFPTSRERIWRPFDLSRRKPNIYVRVLFEAAPGRGFATIAGAVKERGPAVARAVSEGHVREREPAVAAPLVAAEANARADLLLWMLMGVAAGLLLIAAANVVSLELATAMARTRSHAIHAALGAGRARLVRIGLIEGAFMIGASAALAWTIAHWSIGVLAASLPPAMSDPLTNPIDLDVRSLVFMIAAAFLAWLLTSVPVVLRATRPQLADVLRRDDRTHATSGAGFRQALMAFQISVTIVLLVCAVLVIRTYATQLALEKGFDSRNVATIRVGQQPRAATRPADLEQTILSRLRSQPGISAVARTDSLPPSSTAGIGNKLSIDGRPTTAEQIKLTGYTVDPEFFSTMGIRLLAGRTFTASDPAGYLVIDERFARRFWPDGSALGARFNMGGGGLSGASNFEVIGIAAALRVESTETPGGLESFVVYNRIRPAYFPLTFVARLDHERQLPALTTLVRSLAPGAIVRVELVDTLYERLFGDVRLAAAVTTSLGALAFIVASAGVYGVMAFLVSGRTREIGVRMALGAAPADIRRMILLSSARTLVAGVALGVPAAALIARGIESMLFGVSAVDPLTYSGVLLLVILTALAATLIPALHAARVDPTVALRAE
jgi:putative ABC transport system permease protein